VLALGALSGVGRAAEIKNGQIALSGPSAELLNNPRVIKAYLGT
jgi:ABC-type branched-subunit amino acid transport system ATPase component